MFLAFHVSNNTQNSFFRTKCAFKKPKNCSLELVKSVLSKSTKILILITFWFGRNYQYNQVGAVILALVGYHELKKVSEEACLSVLRGFEMQRNFFAKILAYDSFIPGAFLPKQNNNKKW